MREVSKNSRCVYVYYKTKKKKTSKETQSLTEKEEIKECSTLWTNKNEGTCKNVAQIRRLWGETHGKKPKRGNYYFLLFLREAPRRDAPRMHYYADDRWKITSPSATPTLITPPLSFLIVLLREDTENIYNLRHTLYIGSIQWK